MNDKKVNLFLKNGLLDIESSADVWLYEAAMSKRCRSDFAAVGLPGKASLGCIATMLALRPQPSFSMAKIFLTGFFAP